ncbi:hypothetical protein FB45DRAFT_932656 [Roridomyces roridus]|uniref:C2H2-type domain-containing protein n=1 Tax=Roridomyces roridus TaxID=1738132 RepID=A0AAD7FDK7_9AGAR|nr:hypothetical protein FB45DRAFT_932656 [Roridomyces roridus]
MSPASSSQQVVLPSIHEMLPEHLISPPVHLFLPNSLNYKLDMLRRQQPQVHSHQPFPSYDFSPRRRRYSESSSSSTYDEEEVETVTAPPTKRKRHSCNLCGKLFTRPSSLRTHTNTHTGAMPFRCTHPNCGRRFNVQSNMRRHMRTHPSTDGDSPPPLTPSPSS